MARKVGKKNVVKADLCMYDYVLLENLKLVKQLLRIRLVICYTEMKVFCY